MGLTEDLITYEYEFVHDDGEFSKRTISIEKKNLIKPEDLHKHVGEVLSFHNKSGYVVTGRLICGDVDDYDEYSYGSRNQDIDYEDELDMCWFYEPDSQLSEYFTLQYAYVLKCQNIHHDELMHNISYVAVMSEDEKAFREKILSMSNDELSERYHYLKSIEEPDDD